MVDSLGFDLLDRHVVHGRAEDMACSDSAEALSYAQLLERVAALAGGLRAVGVGEGDEVAVNIGPGNLQMLVVCACVRLGAVPGATGDVRIVESAEGVSVHANEEHLDLDLVMKAGRADPAPSLPFDPPGYAEAVLENWPILNALRA